MQLIVAVDENWAIGNKGQLLASIPEDMKFFRTTTLNNVIVMGRNTLESLPNQKPLKNRINIVITGDKSYNPEGVIIVRNLYELDKELKKYNTNDVYVIGGASIYRQLLNKCDIALITKIYNKYEADTSIPNLDRRNDWECINTSELKEYENIKYQFCEYKNTKF